MLFKDADNRFPQVVCRADVDASPLFPEVFEPHVIQCVTDDVIRIILFKIGQVVTCVFD